MRRWFIRISLTLVLVLLVVGVIGAVYYRQATRVPDWYAEARRSQIDHNPAIQQRLTPLHNWASKARAGDPDAKTDADRRHTLVLTGDEINALIGSWSETLGLDEKIQQQATGIRVRVADGKITIAAELVKEKRVISVVLEPVQGSDGYAALKLNSLEVGNAWVPLVAFDSKRTQADGWLGRYAKDNREKIDIDAHGEATGTAAMLYYASLSSDLFAGETVDAYAFVSHDQLSFSKSSRHPLATRVREIKIDNNKLTVTLEALTPEQREALVKRLKSLGDAPEKSAK